MVGRPGNRDEFPVRRKQIPIMSEEFPVGLVTGIGLLEFEITDRFRRDREAAMATFLDNSRRSGNWGRDPVDQAAGAGAWSVDIGNQGASRCG